MRAIHTRRASSAGALICVFALVIGVSPSKAFAGMCGTPTVRVYPRGVKTVPANVQLRVRVHSYDVVDAHDDVVPATVPIAFTLVPEHGDALTLRATREPDATRVAGGTLAWLTLTADRPLVVGEKYALVRDHEKLAWIEPFTVEPALPDVAPAFTVRSARFVTTRPTGNSKGSVYGDHIVVVLGETSVPSAQLVFTVTPLDLAPAAPIWRDVEKGAIEFGAIGECGYRDLALAGHGRQRFELRAVDLAGHHSAPITITIDTGAVNRARPASNPPHR